MKCLNFYLFVFYCLTTLSVFAQAPRRIVEDDLAKSFKRIDYWDQRHNKDTSWSDSLQAANDVFGKKLQYYTNNYPETMSSLYNLEALGLKITESSDGLFRIYSWDEKGGGTMHEFENVMQYRDKDRTHSIWARDTDMGRLDKYIPFYTKIYTLKVKNKIYYLGIYAGIYCSACRGQGLQVFSIENGKLNDDVKIIKTHTGLHSQLYYEYNLYYALHKNARSLLHFDASSKTIFVPVVEKEKITNYYLLYRFNGQYFERVKN
ncbi:MAG: hypothetical protein JST19_00165 [Bacteroidetes bacterium]|nr:hypothetical protein [Bacteroidota bacterium]